MRGPDSVAAARPRALASEGLCSSYWQPQGPRSELAVGTLRLRWKPRTCFYCCCSECPRMCQNTECAKTTIMFISCSDYCLEAWEETLKNTFYHFFFLHTSAVLNRWKCTFKPLWNSTQWKFNFLPQGTYFDNIWWWWCSFKYETFGLTYRLGVHSNSAFDWLVMSGFMSTGKRSIWFFTAEQPRTKSDVYTLTRVLLSPAKGELWRFSWEMLLIEANPVWLGLETLCVGRKRAWDCASWRYTCIRRNG